MTCPGGISHLKLELWRWKWNWWVDFESKPYFIALSSVPHFNKLPFLMQKTENNVKIEDKEERLIKNVPEEIKETKVDTFKEKWDVPKIDLETPNRDNDNLIRDKLEEKDRNQELPPKLLTDPKVEKTGNLTFFTPVIYSINFQL